MNVERRNDALIYCLSSGPTIPEWLGDRARRNLSKRDESIRRRIELIQDFQMPSSSTKIVQSNDGRYVIVTGTYPPRVRCYDLHELTMKFERYLDSHCLDIVMLGEDYGKMALLLDDRTISFHAPYGAHESVRIPTFGRGMAYEPSTCDLLLASKGNNIYRLNLDEGRFNEPWSFTPSGVSSTCISVSPSYPLATVGCEDGTLRLWDNRAPDMMLNPFLSLDVSGATKGLGYSDEFHPNPAEISCVAHDPSGLHMAVGTAGGLAVLYDVRSSKPLHVMEHKAGTRIHTVRFHKTGCILSGDEKLVKIWRYRGSSDVLQEKNTSIGSVIANVEGAGKLSHFIMAGDENDPIGHNSGLLLCATDQPKMESYYIPSVGLAPKWCSFLENITEELEERDLARGESQGDMVQDGQESIYENYKFVSREEVEKLGISNLVGTPLLRGYMHGFFMDINLYNRVRAVANPFEYEEYRKKKLKERMETKRASRIAPKETKKTKVNPELASRLQEKAQDRTKSGKVATQVLGDDRFGSLFTNPDYEIDEEHEDFKLRNPSGVAASKRRQNDIDSDAEDDDDSVDQADPVEEEKGPIGYSRVELDESENETYSSADSESDDDGFHGARIRGEMYEETKSRAKTSIRQKVTKAKKKHKDKKKKKRVMYEANGLATTENVALEIGMGDPSAQSKAAKRKQEMSMPLSKRLAIKEAEGKVMSEATTVFVKGQGASREVTYIPMNARKEQGTDTKTEGRSKRKRSRRGIKDLGFKTPFKHTR